MGAAFDPNAVHYIYMKVVGGEVAPAAALAPKCSPIGMPPKKVGEDIQKATKDWKAIKEPARDRKKTKNVVHNGKLTMDQICEIAKKMRPKSYAAEFSGTVKEVLGTCVSVGCSIDGKSPKDVQAAIDSGDVDVGE